jgi:hypothetical protein
MEKHLDYKSSLCKRGMDFRFMFSAQFPIRRRRGKTHRSNGNYRLKYYNHFHCDVSRIKTYSSVGRPHSVAISVLVISLHRD